MESEIKIECEVGFMEAIRRKTGEIFVIKCDKNDLPMLSQYKWLVSSKCLSVFRRVQEGRKSTTISLHRFLIKTKFINFKNGDKLDFRRENLFGSEKGKRDRKSGVFLKGNPFIVTPNGDVTVYTTNRQGKEIGCFFIDKEDLDFVTQYTWGIDGHGYVTARARGLKGKAKHIKLHRVIMNAQDGDEIDHINRIRHDDRKGNLRICTASENHHNTGLYRDNATGVTGVSPDKNWWRAMIQIKGKILRKGFPTFAQAVAQRKQWEDQYNPSGLEG
jgi:hypothetical protein